jgi:hypothetical protein
MAGNGAYPINSSWLADGSRKIGAGMLYGSISFGDTSTDEGTLWGNWFFGVTATFIPAWAIPSNLPGGGAYTT